MKTNIIVVEILLTAATAILIRMGAHLPVVLP